MLSVLVVHLAVTAVLALLLLVVVLVQEALGLLRRTTAPEPVPAQATKRRVEARAAA